MNIYILDDEFHALEILASYTDRTAGLSLCGAFTDPAAALAAIATTRGPGVFFLDIEMPALSGFEVAKMLGRHIKVIFTTSFREFGPEAFELQAFDYLLKPVSYSRFLASIQRVRDEINAADNAVNNNSHYFFIKTETKGKLLRILTSDILYIRAGGNYVDIVLIGGVITAYLTLQEISEKLPPGLFVQVHRSCVVNMRHVCAIEAGKVKLSNNEDLSLSRGYRELFLKKLENNLFISHRDPNA